MTEYNLESVLEARVQRGIALLDSARPAWREDIDTEILNVGDLTRCPLGQLFGDYCNGISALDSIMRARGEDAILPCEYGFEHEEWVGITYEDLTGAWHWALTR